MPCGSFLQQAKIWCLPDSEKNLMMCLFVLTESTNVTDTQTDGQTQHDDMPRLHSIARQKLGKKSLD